MSDPIVPNYKKNVGRLVTDRYDFEEHIVGTKFRHNADTIDVVPNLVVGSSTSVNVLEALEALRDATLAPVIADATTSNKGIIQLAGDIGGIATNIIVTRIQSKPISSLTPSNGDVLTWDGYTNVWSPAAAVNIFSAGGDLGGNNVLQTVISLTGTQQDVSVGPVVKANNSVINFINTVSPLITTDTSSNNGKFTTIRAQSATGTNKNGGAVIIAGGAPGSGGLKGKVTLQLTSSVPAGYPATSLSGITSSNMVQLSEVIVGKKVLSLCHAADLNAIDMPASTGDMVIYIRNATARPTSGSPSNGAILYAHSGELWIKQQNGDDFQIGTNQNPNIWGPTGAQTYTFRNSVPSFGGSGVLGFSFNLPDQTCVAIDVTLVGKRNASSDSAQFNLRMAYTRQGGGAPIPLGSVTTLDSRTSGAASGWNVPQISVSGNTLQIFTGSETGTVITWLVVTQLTISFSNA